jgi:amidophosphoribosyltransferase
LKLAETIRMSDPIHHECGLALVRLKKPLSYFYDKYGTPLWGFQRLYLLMEKQHNRGQDGIGIGCCKLNMPLGQAYLFRERSAKRDSLIKTMEEQVKKFGKLKRTLEREMEKEQKKAKSKRLADQIEVEYRKRFPDYIKENFGFGGELLLGHLR